MHKHVLKWNTKISPFFFRHSSEKTNQGKADKLLKQQWKVEDTSNPNTEKGSSRQSRWGEMDI